MSGNSSPTIWQNSAGPGNGKYERDNRINSTSRAASFVTTFPELGVESLEGPGCPGALGSVTGGVDPGIVHGL